MEWLAKYLLILHVELDNVADGEPQFEGFGLPFKTSCGIAARKKDPRIGMLSTHQQAANTTHR